MNYSFKENSFNNADVCRFLTYPYNKTKGMELYNRILFKKNKYNIRICNKIKRAQKPISFQL